MEDSKKIESGKLIEQLNSTVLYEIAFAAAHLGMSGDPEAVEPLFNKSMISNDWLIQDFAIRALKYLKIKIPEAGEALKNVKKIEPPGRGLIVSIQPSEKTIYAYLDFELGSLLIGGRARSSNVDIQQIYKSIKSEMDLFDQAYPKKPLVISLWFDIVESGNCRALLWLLKNFKHHPDVIIYWYHCEDDADMIDLAEQFNELGRFNIITLIMPFEADYHYSSFLRGEKFVFLPGN